MRLRRVGRLVWLVAALLPLAGCARTGSGGGGEVPQWIIRFVVDFAGPVDNTAYYFIAINAINDLGASGPLPVAAGPFWGNGWGTGSITHFVEYTAGRYSVFQQNRRVVVEQTGGGIVAFSGVPTAPGTGRYDLTVQGIDLGAATVTGTGTITSARNGSDQNAGVFHLATDTAGRTVAGQVAFAPAANGGRTPNSAEQAALSNLNAGGVRLTSRSLSAFGLTLTLGAAKAGTQSLTVAPTIGTLSVRFRPDAGTGKTSTGTVAANSTTATKTPPVPGATLTTTTLVRQGTASFRSENAPTSTLIGLPYEAQAPFGGSQLDVTLDTAVLGSNVNNIDVNIISTTQIILDPTVTDPAQHCYDGLGLYGNNYLNFSTQQNRTLTNSDQLTPETSGDPTLRGSATQAERDAVDIIDWTITISHL